MKPSPNPSALRVPVPPPALFFLALGFGAGMNHLRPASLHLDPAALRFVLAGLLLALSVGLGAWAFLALRMEHTSPEFGQEVTELVQKGPYRFTRNPLYVALVLLLAAFAAILDNAWAASAAPLLGASLDRLVIAREEPFLEHRFGEAYLTYKRHVRRWI